MSLVGIYELWANLIAIDTSNVNITRSDGFPIMTEYFINPEKYFYLIALHMCVTGAMLIIITLTTGTMFVTFFYCLYGMFQIARYVN